MASAHEQIELGARAKPVITADGLRFRDLEADGQLAPFEDWRLSPERRAEDLVRRMTLAEKVGMLMHSTLPGQGGEMGRAPSYDLEAAARLVETKHVTSFITRLTLPPAELAEQNNAIQALAEATRLGIPLTISSDPRNHFQYVLGASESSAHSTQWPELLGFAALRDPELVRRFADIARKEYRAVGIHMTLSPQLDLATEPRWPRQAGTFGSEAELTSRLGAAYVAGFQGAADGLARDGVIAVVKHWVGYGAQPDGYDGHNYYGRFARPGAAFAQHVEAFRGALAAGAGGVMPAYPILQDTAVLGQPAEQLSPGYSKQLLQDLLRGEFGYRGLILSDWAITRDCPERCRAPTADAPQRPPEIATPWGVEDLGVKQRYIAGLAAGLDQFGGTDEVGPLLEAAEAGEVSTARLDQSVVRVLIPKFRLGLFDNPYVDPQLAAAVTATEQDRALATRVQATAQVLLKNAGGVLPLPADKRRVWLQGVDPAAAREAGLIPVDDPAAADVVLVRAESPAELLHPHHFFGSRQKEGRLDFRPGDPAYDALLRARPGVPRVLAVFLDRPAVLTGIADHADVILANFGASDKAVFDVLLGRAAARGRLPFELPSSMSAVEGQDPGAPDDSAMPLFPAGAGIILQ
ncbi:MAG TPA: glycoside hydrolase family 3 N-terminal domain-containing protein [Croceibacterium sp.]